MIYIQNIWESLKNLVSSIFFVHFECKFKRQTLFIFIEFFCFFFNGKRSIEVIFSFSILFARLFVIKQVVQYQF